MALASSSIAVLRAFAVAALLAVALLTAGDATAQQARAVASRTMPSVVYISVTTAAGSAIGSGFVVAPGIIATAYHVVDGMRSGTVRFVGASTETPIRSLLVSSREQDLALLAADTGNAKPLALAEASQVAVGDQIWALGNPEGYEGTISEGIVSAIRTTRGVMNYQITASTFPGSSGGPIVNAFAEVVGVLLRGVGETLNFIGTSTDVAALLRQANGARQAAPPVAVAQPPARPAAPAPAAAVQGTYGDLALKAGFDPDPTTVEVLAGGILDAETLSAACSGFIGGTPDVMLNYSAGALFNLHIYVQSTADTTLVVRLPNGKYACDDDGAGELNPLVTVENPASGFYAIWVGVFLKDDYPSATVHVSEVGPA